MPVRSVFPPGIVVARREDLRARGISNQRIRTAVRTGRWQEPVRGVVVPHAGALTQRERWLVALAYAGPDACLSHHSALRVWGARAEEPAAAVRVAGVLGNYRAPDEGGMVEVSTRHGNHMSSHGFVVVHQSRRPLDGLELAGGLRVTPAARAVVDVCLTATRRADVDHAVSDVLQRGLTDVARLLTEAERAGTASTRGCGLRWPTPLGGCARSGSRTSAGWFWRPACRSRSGTRRSTRRPAPASWTPCGAASGSPPRRTGGRTT